MGDGHISFSKVNDPKGIRTPVNRRLAEHEAAPIKDGDEGAVAVALGRRGSDGSGGATWQ